MTPLERAKNDLARLQKDLGRAKATLAMLEGQIGRVEAYIEMAPVYESDEAAGEATRARSSGIAATSVRLAVEAIRERGERIHTRELITILQDRGVTVGGSNPVANLSGFLSRSEELHNSRADGWGLTIWETEQAPSGSAILMKKAAAELEQTEGRTQAVRAKINQSAGPEWEPSGDLDDENPLLATPSLGCCLFGPFGTFFLRHGSGAAGASLTAHLRRRLILPVVHRVRDGARGDVQHKLA